MKKMVKKIILLALILLLALASAGCKDYQDIDERLIATTVAVDLKDGKVCILAEIADISAGGKSGQQGSSSGSQYKIYKGTGEDIVQARRNLDMQFEKQLYLSAATTLILTESFAKEHLVEYLNRLEANEEYRKKVITVTTRDDLEKLFEMNNDSGVSAGDGIQKLMNTIDNNGQTFPKTTARLMENLNDEYTGILIPCIGMQEKHNVLVGYSVVSDSKVTGFIPEKQAESLVFLKAKKPKLTYTIPYKDVDLTIEVGMKKRKITPSYTDGKISFKVAIDLKAQIESGNKKVPYQLGKQAYDELEKIISEKMKQEVTKAIEDAQKKYQCDYLQFDDYFRIKYPEAFDKMAEDWGNKFSNATVQVNVNTKVSTIWAMDLGEYRLR